LPLHSQDIVDTRGDAALPTQRGAGESILLVGGEESASADVKNGLESLGYAVTAEPDSEAALALFASDPNHWEGVFLNQVAAPELDLNFAQKLRTLLASVPLVLIVDRDGRAPSKESLGLGCIAYVESPTGPVALGEALRRAVGPCSELKAGERNVTDTHCG
jgi:DNA-binding response OmpR family regulator